MLSSIFTSSASIFLQISPLYPTLTFFYSHLPYRPTPPSTTHHVPLLPTPLPLHHRRRGGAAEASRAGAGHPSLPDPRASASCSPWSSTPPASNRGAEDLAADRAPLRSPHLRRWRAHRAEGRGERHLPPVVAPSPSTCPGGRIAGSSSSAAISSSPRRFDAAPATFLPPSDGRRCCVEAPGSSASHRRRALLHLLLCPSSRRRHAQGCISGAVRAPERR
jgi:hypothetical protein